MAETQHRHSGHERTTEEMDKMGTYEILIIVLATSTEAVEKTTNEICDLVDANTDLEGVAVVVKELGPSEDKEENKGDWHLGGYI